MDERKLGIILQARMGSTRLPGKVMKPLAGKPMLQWIIERLKSCQTPAILILATTTLEQDQPLVEFAEKMGVDWFCGSEANVLDRYYQCALTHELDDIVRATGDNPFVDPEACDRLVNFYRYHKLDYATISNGPKDGYPLGVGVEIFSFSALEKSYNQGILPHHQEHVNEYILENPAIFKQAKMSAPPEKRGAELSLTVDTIDEFKYAEIIYNSYFRQNSDQLVPVAWAIDWLKNDLEEQF